MKLDVGAGGVKEEGWTTLDRFTPADIEADMWAIPLDDGSVDEVWCSHALEHIAPEQVVPALREMCRVLVKGGKATITVPNFDFVAAVWLHGGDRMWAQQLIFGSQKHEGEVHRTAFNLSLFRGDIEAAGFTVVSVGPVYTPEYNQESLRAEAVKP